MIKHIVFLNSKVGMDRQAFIDRYEGGHVPLVRRLMPFYADYRRNFVMAPEPGRQDGLIRPQGFDVITELWYESPEKLEAVWQTHAETDAGPQIDADEAHFFDRSRMIMLAADECRTPQEKLRARPSGQVGEPAVKLMLLMNRREGMSPEGFRAHYENVHAPLALETLVDGDGVSLYAAYARSYPQAESCIAIGERSGPQPLPADVVTEIVFWTEADWQAFLALNAGAAGDRLNADVLNFIAPDSSRFFRVEEYIAGPPLVAAA